MDELTHFSEAVGKTVKGIEKTERLGDLTDTISSAYKKIEIILNNDYVAERGLSMEQVYQTLGGLYNPTQISFVHTENKKTEPSKIIVGFSKDDSSDMDFLRNIYFMNSLGEQVKLDEIAELKNTFAGSEIYTDTRSTTIHMYAEIGENSVVYPVLKLYKLFGSKDFESLGYRKISSSPYQIDFV